MTTNLIEIFQSFLVQIVDLLGSLWVKINGCCVVTKDYLFFQLCSFCYWVHCD